MKAMMTVEVKVNGVTIEHYYIQRGHELNVDEYRGAKPCAYYYERWVPGQTSLISGHVEHNYPGGAGKLVQTVLEDIDERKLHHTISD